MRCRWLVAAVLLTSSAACGASEDAVDAVDPDALRGVLVDWRDVEGWSGPDERPLPVSSEEYSTPPEQVCEDGGTVSLLGNDAIFYTMTDDTWVFAGEWVSGETVEAAASRVTGGVEAVTACTDELTWTALSIQREGVDEVHRFRGFEGEDDPAGIEFVYARNGGVIVLLTLTGPEDDWTSGEKDAVIEAALSRLAFIGRVEVDPTRNDQVPPPTTATPEPALYDLLIRPDQFDDTRNPDAKPVPSNSDSYTDPTDVLCQFEDDLELLATPAVMSSVQGAAKTEKFPTAWALHWASVEATDDAAARFTASVDRLARCREGYTAHQVARPDLDSVWQFELADADADTADVVIVYAQRAGVLTLLWVQGDDNEWAPVTRDEIIELALDQLGAGGGPVR